MKRVILIAIGLVLIHSNLISQTEKEARKVLEEINSLDQIDSFKIKYPDWWIDLDKTPSIDSIQFSHIVNAKIGAIVKKQYNRNAPTFLLKVLERRDEELCNVKYIYLDGSKLTKKVIDSLRTTMIEKYKNGTDFSDLVNEYTMDGNETGNTGWFYKGMMVDEFDDAVRFRSKGEIFTVDVIRKNWYYVVLKSCDNLKSIIILSASIKYGI